MPWLILGLLAATAVVLSQSGGGGGGGSGSTDRDGSVEDTARELAEGKDAGRLDAVDSIAATEKVGGAEAPIVIGRWKPEWTAKPAATGYETGFRAELIASVPGYEVDGPVTVATTKIKKRAKTASSRDALGLGHDTISRYQVDAINRLNLEGASAADPLRGYVAPALFTSTLPVDTPFGYQMIERANYFWDYLKSLNSVAKKMDEIAAKSPTKLAEVKKVADALLSEDLQRVLTPLQLFIDQNSSFSVLTRGNTLSTTITNTPDKADEAVGDDATTTMWWYDELGKGAGYARVVLASQAVDMADDDTVNKILTWARIVMGETLEQRENALYPADGPAVAVIAQAMAYGVPYGLFSPKMSYDTEGRATFGAAPSRGRIATVGLLGAKGSDVDASVLDAKTVEQQFYQYFYGYPTPASCLATGMCSLIDAFTTKGLPEDQAALAKDAFSYLRYFVHDNPLAAAAYTTGAYMTSNWMATALIGSQLTGTPASNEGVFIRKFFELLVAAVGVAAAMRYNIPAYRWAKVIEEAGRGWDGGVTGARASKFPWPGASGIAFAWKFADEAAQSFK